MNRKNRQAKFARKKGILKKQEKTLERHQRQHFAVTTSF